MNLRKFTDFRAWLRALGKTSVHAGTGAILSGFGTNGAENLAPEAMKGIGLSSSQMLAVFAASSLLAALKFIHESTEETRPPMPTP